MQFTAVLKLICLKVRNVDQSQGQVMKNSCQTFGITPPNSIVFMEGEGEMQLKGVLAYIITYPRKRLV